MDREDLVWLAGLLEGEGYFAPGPPSIPDHPVIQLCMTDRDIIERVANLWGTNYIGEANRGEGWNTAYRIFKRGYPAVELMLELYPLMGERRKQQIEKAVRSASLRGKGDWKRRIWPKDEAKIRSYREKGLTFSEIAEKYSVTRSTIWRHVHHPSPTRITPEDFGFP